MSRADKFDAKFWKYETPEELRTGKNTFRYYPKAGRLVAHLPNYFSDRDDAWKMGKGTSINLESLKARPEVIDRLVEILESLKGDTNISEEEENNAHN